MSVGMPPDALRSHRKNLPTVDDGLNPTSLRANFRSSNQLTEGIRSSLAWSATALTMKIISRRCLAQNTSVVYQAYCMPVKEQCPHPTVVSDRRFPRRAVALTSTYGFDGNFQIHRTTGTGNDQCEILDLVSTRWHRSRIYRSGITFQQNPSALAA